VAQRFWSIVNPLVRPLAGFMPWWVLLETTGRRTGRRRLKPFVNGPIDDGVLLLLAVHGDRSAFAHNIAADPRVRVQRRGRWRSGTATLVDLDPEVVRRFSLYGRIGLKTLGEDSRLLQIQLD
jgi:deazaflavin-dependent oxidoreductase (nitroreductase family)